NPPSAFQTEKFRTAFGGTLRRLNVNWSRLVIDSMIERLQVNGIRTSGRDADPDLWSLWQASDLDADSMILHSEALVNGMAFTFVWPNPAGEPRITVETAQQVTAIFEPGTRRVIAAALKRWVDPVDLRVHATLFTPDEITMYVSTCPVDALTADLGTFVPAVAV